MTSDQFEILLEFYNATTRRKPAPERLHEVKCCLLAGKQVEREAQAKALYRTLISKAELLERWIGSDTKEKARMLMAFGMSARVKLSLDEVEQAFSGEKVGSRFIMSVKHFRKRAQMIADYANRYNAAKVKAG